MIEKKKITHDSQKVRATENLQLSHDNEYIRATTCENVSSG